MDRAPRRHGRAARPSLAAAATWITPGRGREVDVEAPPRPAEQRVPRFRLALDQRARPFGAIAGEVGLGVARQAGRERRRSGATRSIAALARPVSGMARGSISLARPRAIRRRSRRPAPRVGTTQRRPRRRLHRPAVELDRPSRRPRGSTVDGLPEALHCCSRSCSSQALLSSRGANTASITPMIATIAPTCGQPPAAHQVGVDDRDAEEEDRQAAQRAPAYRAAAGCRHSASSSLTAASPWFASRARAARRAAPAAAPWPPPRPPPLASGAALALTVTSASASGSVEPQHRQALGEMRRQLGGDVDLAAVGRVDPDAPRMEVELAADPAGQERLGPAIFGVADDRMADRRHVRAQLVGAAGQRLQLDPGGAVAGAVDHPPAGLGRKPVLLARCASSRRRCPAAWRAARRSSPSSRVGHADDQRPIDLARGPARKGLGEMARPRAPSAPPAARPTCPCRAGGRAWAARARRRARRAAGRDAGWSWSRPASRGPAAC